MPGFRGRRGGRPAGRGRGGRKGPAPPQHDHFKSSRMREIEYGVVRKASFGLANAGRDDDEQGEPPSDDGTSPEQEQDLSNEGDSAQSGSEDESEVPSSNAYALLLQSCNSKNNEAEPPRKKRKTINGTSKEDNSTKKHSANGDNIPGHEAQADEVEGQLAQLDQEIKPRDAETFDEDVDSEDEGKLQRDPFEKHFTAVSEQDLISAVREVEEKQWNSSTSTLSSDTRRTALTRQAQISTFGDLKTAQDAYLKQKLNAAGNSVISGLSGEERNLAGGVFEYVDVLNGCRSLKNSGRLRDLSCLHALNHVFKTRDRVLKNNSKLAAQPGEAPDLRDQGFTRPKVLIIIPTKQACVRMVDSIVKISRPDQQENKARFLETYSHEDEDEWQDKPADFRELFGGNHEEDFRIGLKFTRKTIKYFSGFYNSDIIIGSPLGLMRTITTGGGGSKDKKKAHDADFLSSIEVVIVDHANALQMQNWQHMDYVFSQLNLLPKDSHGCDFSRVRHWYLDGQAKYLRQTIILSEYLTPEINSLVATHLHNIAGRVKYQPTYHGAMLSISTLPNLPYTTSLPQLFQRIPSPNPLTDSDARFKFFTTTILPPLIRDARHQKGVLLFVPTYADFARLRNYLSTNPDSEALSFGSLSEYTPVKDVLRSRSHFLSGRHALLLYSERAHHHFRYRLKGVKKILWYGVPENPTFWAEIISLLGLAGPRDGGVPAAAGKNGTKGVVRALFSKWDALKLERIVGTERVGRLIHDRGGDTFEFV